MLFKSLIIIGALSGLILGSIGTCVPWLFPQVFSPDTAITKEVSFGSLFCFCSVNNGFDARNYQKWVLAEKIDS